MDMIVNVAPRGRRPGRHVVGHIKAASPSSPDHPPARSGNAPPSGAEGLIVNVPKLAHVQVAGIKRNDVLVVGREIHLGAHGRHNRLFGVFESLGLVEADDGVVLRDGAKIIADVVDVLGVVGQGLDQAGSPAEESGNPTSRIQGSEGFGDGEPLVSIASCVGCAEEDLYDHTTQGQLSHVIPSF